MFGGLARVCPGCSFRWTVVAAVSRSWFCPRCGDSPGRKPERVCVCGHLYDDHDVKRDMEPAANAFMVEAGPTKTSEQLAERIAAALDAEPPPFPELGTCLRCACSDYRSPDPVVIRK
jgi:hypothetical protein